MICWRGCNNGADDLQVQAPCKVPKETGPVIHCFDIVVHQGRHPAGKYSIQAIEGLRERTEYIGIFLFFRPSLNHVLFPMFCLLVEGECQILMFKNIIS